MSFANNLYELKGKSYDPFKDETYRNINARIVPCKNSNDYKYQNEIKNELRWAGSYKYPYHEELMEAFPPYS